VSIRFHRETLKPILVDVPLSHALVRNPETLRMRSSNLLKECRQLFAICRLDDEMPMIGHQLVRQNWQRYSLHSLREKRFKLGVLLITEKQTLPLSSTVQHVIDATRFNMTPLRNHRPTNAKKW
jgi:hypothetical protein